MNEHLVTGNKVKKSRSKDILIAILVVIIVISGIIYFTANKTEIGQTKDKATTEGGKYQAVFLTNGQVYFGKLNDEGGDYIKLTDIYYLQAQDQKVQPKEAASQNEPNMTLIKLGKELHAPADEMNISRTQVLFWENINDDGKVMKAIKEYQTSNK